MPLIVQERDVSAEDAHCLMCTGEICRTCEDEIPDPVERFNLPICEHDTLDRHGDEPCDDQLVLVGVAHGAY